MHFNLDCGRSLPYASGKKRKRKQNLIVFSGFELCLVTSLQVAATARRVNWPRRDIRQILCLHRSPLRDVVNESRVITTKSY